MKRFLMLTLVLVLAFGCKKKHNNATGTSGASSSATRFALNANIPSLVGVKSLQELKSLLVKMVTKVNPAMKAQVGPQIENGLRSVLGVADLKFLDQTKNIYLLGVKGKGDKFIPVMVLPYKDGKSLDNSLPQTKQPCKVVKGAYKFQSLEGSFVYVLKSSPKLVVFAFDDPSVLAKVKAFVPTLPLYKIQKPVNAMIRTSVLAPMIDKSIKKTLKQMPKQKLNKTLTQEADLAKDLVKQTKEISVALDYQAGDLVMDYKATLAKDSDLSHAVAASMRKKLTLTRNLPPKGWLVIASDINLKAIRKKWVDLGMETWKELLGVSDQDAKTLKDQYLKLLDLSKGEYAFSVFEENGFPFAMVSITGTRNGKQVYETMRQMIGKLASTALTRAIELSKTDEDKKVLTALNLASVKDFVDSINKLLGDKGVKMTYSTFKDNGYNGEKMMAQVDYTKIPGKETKMVKNMLGDQIGAAWGYKQDSIIFAFGKAPMAILKAVQNSASKDMTLNKIMSAYKGHAFMAGYLSLGELLEVVQKAVPQLATFVRGLSGMNKLMVKFVAGATAATNVSGMITLPYDDIATLIQKVSPLLGRLH